MVACCFNKIFDIDVSLQCIGKSHYEEKSACSVDVLLPFPHPESSITDLMILITDMGHD